MNAYNYSIVENHKQKIVFPFIHLEVSGWWALLLYLLELLVITFLLGSFLYFILGTDGYLYAGAIGIGITIMTVTVAEQVDKTTGKNKIFEFYYISIKRYHTIVDSNGKKHFICPKKKGVIWIACR